MGVLCWLLHFSPWCPRLRWQFSQLQSSQHQGVKEMREHHGAEGLACVGQRAHSWAPVPRRGRRPQASLLAGSQNVLWALRVSE